MPFEPVNETAQWRVVYDILLAAEVEKVVTYRELGEALELDPVRDRHRIQAAARHAAKKLLKQEDRAVETLTGRGYRLVPAQRNIALAGRQADRAGNALARGQDLTTHVRLDELSETERQIVSGMSLMFAQVGQWAKQVERRVDSHDGRLSDIEKELQRLRDERAGS